MSWVMAGVYDRVMARGEAVELGAWRQELLGELRGAVVEIGAGTGANLAYYPPAVERLLLVEPDMHMRRRLQRRLERCPRHGVTSFPGHLEEVAGLEAGLDAAIVTLVLCSVADPLASLQQIHRLLKPGGHLVFLEHVGAGRVTARRAWQRRLEPAWRCLAGNCHLTRDTEALITQAGFELDWIRREPMAGAVPLIHDSIRGVARRWATPLR